MIGKDFFTCIRICFSIMAVAGHKLKLIFALSIVMDILTVVFSVAAPALLKTLIDSYSDNLPSYNLAWVGAAYGLVWLASELMLRLRAVFSSILIEQVKKEASIRFCLNTIFIWDSSQPAMSSGVFANKFSRINSALPIFLDGVLSQVLPLIVRFFLSIGILIQFLPVIYSLTLALVVFAFGTISYFTFKLIGERQTTANKISQTAYEVILDLLKNREIVIAHSNENTEKLNIERNLNEINTSEVKNTITNQFIGGAQIAVMGAGLTIITVLSAVDLSKDVISVGDFVQINAYLLQFVLPVSYFGLVISSIKRASVTIAENSAFLLTRSLDYKQHKIDCTALSAPSIEVDNIYVKGFDDSFILKNVSFKVPPGESIAIVGSSGSGKSTLLKSLAGLYKLHSGDIYVDSERLSNTNVKKLRCRLGYVPQEHCLFNRTIKSNIFSTSNKHYDKTISFYDSSNMPPMMKEDGNERTLEGLSGGEKQRISLARAVARNSKLLLLDEPTNSLDVNSKKIINNYIFQTLKHHTTRIIITHDLEEARLADHIIVLLNGSIVETGSPAQLISSRGWYYENLFKPATI